MSQVTDSLLILKILKGEKEHYSLLIKKYQLDVYKLACMLLQNTTDAEDAASEVFLKAFLSLKTFQSNTDFKNWLLKITYNYCIDVMRKRKRHILTANLNDYNDEKTSSDSEPLQAVIKDEEKKLLWQALNKLDTQDRTAVILKYYHNASYQTIANILQWPTGTVASRLSRARGKMKHYLQGGI